jgi:hypothetical protein
MTRLLLLVLFMAAPISVKASDSMRLLKDCNHMIATMEGRDGGRIQGQAWYCLGYLSGFLDAHTVASSFGGANRLFCGPPKVSNEQLVRVVVKYLSDNPDKLNQDPGLVTMLALAKSFPCRPATPQASNK